MQAAQAQADELRQRWEYLDAGQLLKHFLGLACDKKGVATTLLCLWFDAGTDEAEAHRDELVRFGKGVEGDRIRFRSMTYQELFTNLRAAAGPPHGEYIRYLTERYFGPTQ